MPARRRFVVPLQILAILLSASSWAQTFPAHSRRLPPPATQSDHTATPARPSPGNWQQLAKFNPGQGFTLDFGDAVAISGDTVVAGIAPSLTNPTAAFVYAKGASGWRSSPPVAALSFLIPENENTVPVAIDGDTIVIGAPSYETGGSSAYVFVKPASGWTNMTPTAVLTPSDTLDGHFGYSVAINGNTIVVGDSGQNSFVGAAYVFVKPAGGWTNMTETAKLTASNGEHNDSLGTSVSVSGATVAVGAPGFGANYGKAYVFVEPPSGWASMTQTAELLVPPSQAVEETGASIAVDGNTVLVGAPAYCQGGAAYVFVKPSSGWTDMNQTATLTPGDGQQPCFGASVGLSGKTAIISAPRRSYGIMYVEGGTYVFEQPIGGWQSASGTTVLTGSDARFYSFFGESVGISGNVVASGAPYDGGVVFVHGLP
jgi:hypothetical protein